MDGTFKVYPDLSTQVFTVLRMYRDVTFPLVYVLLKDRTELPYQLVLIKINECCKASDIDFQASATVISDHELGLMNAYQRIFPPASTRLCFSILHKGLCKSGTSNLVCRS
jgi:hypothetical protein